MSFLCTFRCVTTVSVKKTSAASHPASSLKTARVRKHVQNEYFLLFRPRADGAFIFTAVYSVHVGFYLISPSEYERFSLSAKVLTAPVCSVQLERLLEARYHTSSCWTISESFIHLCLIVVAFTQTISQQVSPELKEHILKLCSRRRPLDSPKIVLIM